MPAIGELFRRASRSFVMPAKAGIQVRFASTANEKDWIRPVEEWLIFHGAGMTQEKLLE
jgi:hypothetical protein